MSNDSYHFKRTHNELHKLGEIIRLTPIETKLFCLLDRHGTISVRTLEKEYRIRAHAVHISNLRAKIEPLSINIHYNRHLDAYELEEE